MYFMEIKFYYYFEFIALPLQVYTYIYRFLQSAVANGTSNPQHGGPVIRTFQLSPQRV